MSVVSSDIADLVLTMGYSVLDNDPQRSASVSLSNTDLALGWACVRDLNKRYYFWNGLKAKVNVLENNSYDNALATGIFLKKIILDIKFIVDFSICAQ